MPALKWNNLCAPQLRTLATEDALVIIPAGSTEQHGPHLPVQVDALLATEVALGCASRFPAPEKAPGHSHHLVRTSRASHVNGRDLHP